MAERTAATMTTSSSFCAVTRDLAEPEAKLEIRWAMEAMVVVDDELEVGVVGDARAL